MKRHLAKTLKRGSMRWQNQTKSDLNIIASRCELGVSSRVELHYNSNCYGTSMERNGYEGRLEQWGYKTGSEGPIL
jgi:hypothetical protein